MSLNEIRKQTIIKSIRGIVDRRSYLELQQLHDDFLGFSTRENGSVYDETPGERDFEEANKVKDLILKDFPNVKAEVTYTDEWVNLEIKIHIII